MTAASSTPVLVETADTGGRTMPVSMVVCRPERAVTAYQLAEQMPGADGLNVAFIAGTLSTFLAHERAGVALYRVASEDSETRCSSPSTTSSAENGRAHRHLRATHRRPRR